MIHARYPKRYMERIGDLLCKADIVMFPTAFTFDQVRYELLGNSLLLVSESDIVNRDGTRNFEGFALYRKEYNKVSCILGAADSDIVMSKIARAANGLVRWRYKTMKRVPKPKLDIR